MWPKYITVIVDKLAEFIAHRVGDSPCDGTVRKRSFDRTFKKESSNELLTQKADSSIVGRVKTSLAVPSRVSWFAKSPICGRAKNGSREGSGVLFLPVFLSDRRLENVYTDNTGNRTPGPMMTAGVAQSLLWLFAFTALSPLAVLAQTEETVWRHPLIRVKSAPKTASDSVRVEFSVAVTNVNDRALTFLAMGVPDQPPNLPVFSVEYRRAGICRGYMDHDSKVQSSNGIRDGELAASARVEGTISLPPDWERMRVGFGWMGDRKLSRNSWSEETSREEFAGKGQTTGARRKVQPPKIRMLSVSRHVNKDFRGRGP